MPLPAAAGHTHARFEVRVPLKRGTRSLLKSRISAAAFPLSEF